MNDQKIASSIVRDVGGVENIKSVTHCFTRLRFILKDENKAKDEAIKQTEGVISVVKSGGQYQVVCGSKVDAIFQEVTKLVGEQDTEGSEKEEKPAIGNLILQKITEIFTPLIPAIAAAGLIKGLLTAAKILMSQYGVDISTSDTYVILSAASQVIFYFMPIFLAMTSAKALKCNQVVAMMIGATLVYPQIDALIQNTEVATTIFGLPVLKNAWEIGESVKVFSYTESVIPIILAVLVMAVLEKWLKRWIPEVVQLILVPGLELFIMLPLTLVVFGPVGIYVGNGIQFLYDSMMGFSTILGGALIGGLWAVCVIFGAHRALLPIGLNDVAVNGHQNILAFAGSANFAQGGAALGIMLKTKSKELKQVAASATIAATLVGVTEPAIYGCNLRLKKPMIYAVICGAIGGGIMGFGNVYGDSFANNGVLTIFTYAAYGMTKFMFYLIGIAVAYFGSAAMTYFLGFEDIGLDNSKNKTAGKTEMEWKTYDLSAPVEGEAVSLEKVNDEVFSGKTLGDGIAIMPESDVIVAPDDGTVSVLFPTNHAIGITLKNGVELLVHIGINTVALNGDGFKAHVKQGDQLRKGDPIVTFNRDTIKKAGYEDIVCFIISNTDQYAVVNGIEGKHVSLEDTIISVTNK